MVKLKKKAEKAERDVELMAKWRHCAISGEELRQPIAACDLGRLYNKETVLLSLLDKSAMPEVAQHIRSLKDIVPLALTANPSYKPNGEKADAYNDVQAARFVCPVTGLEMSGRYRFAFLRGCGCVFSEKALKEVPSENCHKCGKPFKAADVVVLNGSEEDLERQRVAMEERRRQAKSAKRKRKAESPPEEPSGTGASSSGSEKDSPPAEKRQKLPLAASKSKLPNGTPSSTGATGKGSTSSSKVSGTSKTSAKPTGSSKLNGSSSASAVAKKTTETLSSYSTVAEDPKARKAYKSLFNSGAAEKPREKTAHWVTFFPYH